MMSLVYGALLVLSVLILLYLTQKNYEGVSPYFWAIVVLTPIILLGYWLKTRVSTPEGAALAFCFIYLDSTVLLAIILFAILHFMGVTVRPWIKNVVYGAAFAHIAMIWACFDNDLYYASMTLVDTGMGTATKMTSGPLKVVHWVYLVGILAAIAIVVVVAFARRGSYSRRTLWLYTTMLAIGMVIYAVESLANVDFSSLPVLYVAAEWMVASNYDHMRMHDISGLISEQQAAHGVRGYAAVDLEGRYLGCNKKIYTFLPDLASQRIDARFAEGTELATLFYGLIDNYEMNIASVQTFAAGDSVYQCEVSEFVLRKDGNAEGYLFDVRDVTEEQKLFQLTRDYNAMLNAEVAEKTADIKNIQRTVVLGLANMVENRDSNTGGHVKRTSDIIGFVVREAVRQGVYDIGDQLAEDIVRAAPMHDLGKITIENAILNKPGRLTAEEYEIMKTHSAKSGEFVNIILKDVEEDRFVSVAFNVARYHHERWDGRGYPEGLVGEMIPLEARVMAIADVYDALVSKRVYKKPMSFEQAAQIMVEGMGTQFDPRMYNVFLGCREKLEDYYRTHS
ncbi:MAG: HD domain-containing protein [Coriobacteriales bacterium]|nr:HD domain-containing protein [Coriobacteriales bacterium]